MTEVPFPLEFLVTGTPVSLQTKNGKAKEAWKDRIKESYTPLLPEMHFACEDTVSVTILHFPASESSYDLDNIVKSFLDGMSACIFVDDRQVERILVQRFEKSKVFEFQAPTEQLLQALAADPPVTLVRVHNDPKGDHLVYFS